MRRKRLFWYIFPSFILITLLSLLAVSLDASWFLRQTTLDQVTHDLEARGRLAHSAILADLTARRYARIDAWCKTLGRESGTRFTVILRSGQVVGDTDHTPASMDNHADRPEVIAALAGQVGRSTRYSDTLHTDMRYVAIPLLAQGTRIGVLRAAKPIPVINHALWVTRAKFSLGVLLIASLAALISLLITRRVTRPVEEITGHAEQFADGNLQHQVPLSDVDEFAGLAEALNQMSATLDERLRTTLRQHHEQEAVLTSMLEGVLAVDNQEQILKINQAASHLLGIEPARTQGHSIYEVIRNTDLLQFIAMILASRKPLEKEIILRDPSERYIQVHGTVLQDENGQSIGALVVMSDVTRLRRLEQVRRDFVANVSHELRTPITSIKGFVETLQDGAIEHPADARRFLEIIARHVDRLNAIIEDLLMLSRVEQESEKSELTLESAALRPLLQSAIQDCEVKATTKDIPITLSCPDVLHARLNPALLEQAVVNLITNAINYSEPQRPILVSASQSPSETCITVQDHGCGIAKEYLPRLFERFYRVDKGRSRKIGGTGLGLAIVKHIIQAHGGRVTVESTPGVGSTFMISLPR